MGTPRTLFDKIWSSHVILEREDGSTLLHVDRHLIHDIAGIIISELAERGLPVRHPDRTFAVPDHYTPTRGRSGPDPLAGSPHAGHIRTLESEARRTGMTLFALDDVRQGIVHVIGPEQGITQPGTILVCGDSHTATHGALGALAFGIGASEIAHVLATQALWQKKPKTMRVTIDGTLAPGVQSKDVILALIGKIGAAGGTGYVIEYAGSLIRSLSVEARLTICNMSIEAGARAGMISPDETTLSYLQGRPFAPKEHEWDAALAHWRTLPTEEGARFDREVTLDASAIAPMVTWGTSPEAALPITDRVPDPSEVPDRERRANMVHALDYMGLTPGTPLDGITIDRVFIGSCTNSRIEDLREAARVVDGRKSVVPAMVVPGSGLVKAQAEAEGLDVIFKKAGFEWRDAGCSMCVAINGDVAAPGERCASTSNRNFVGRQGKGARTHLVSPPMAAAAAVTGRLTDVRRLMEGHA
ncbi:3-isopropylmalate dehydratase large subunit [Enterovirga sp. CN4-39]|uniref:3-isopropylmalate dehydratase large subunit n=1 Tax=Enterovirga sp. CN4-39 TaxID=3400910 RepID=UPI003C10F2B0